MRLLDRYLVNGFLSALGFCVGLLVVLFVVIDAFNNLDEFLKHGVSLQIILTYYFYAMPLIVVQAVPVATLVAILFMLGTLNRHNEIIAMKAGGISAFHILSPYLFTGILLSFVIFLVSEKVVPHSAVTSTAIMEGLIEKGKEDLSERAIKNVAVFGSPNRMIYAREFEVLSQTLHDVVVLEDGPHMSVNTKMIAKKAAYDNGQWVFFDAMRYKMNRRGEMIGDPDFAKELVMEIPEKPKDFIQEASQVQFMNTRELGNYIDRLRGSSKKLIHRLLVDYHYKIAFPFVTFVVMLIGAPLAMRSERGSPLLGIGTALGIVVLYYAIESIMLALGKGGTLDPIFSAWSGNLLFAVVGIYLIRRTS